MEGRPSWPPAARPCPLRPTRPAASHSHLHTPPAELGAAAALNGSSNILPTAGAYSTSARLWQRYMQRR